MASRKVSLSINNVSIPIDDFVQVFINSVVTSMISTLKGVDEIRSVDLSFNGDELVINVNGAVVPSNEFVNEFVRNTITGMVSSLKGVGQVDKLEITITE